MPHGHYYLWNPGVVWLHLLSDVLIVLAYYSILITLIYFVRKCRDPEFNGMFACFAVFIVACGTTHLMEIWNIWHPTYWLSGVIKAIAALASVPTAVLLGKLVPRVLALPSPSSLRSIDPELQKEIGERQRAENEIRRLNEDLEKRVRERTLELAASNLALQVSEAKFRRLADANIIGIFFWDARGDITSANDHFLKMVGYTREELVTGQINWKGMTPPEYAHLDKKGLAEIAATGICTPFEKEYIRKDGGRVAIYLGSAVLEGVEDQGICFIVDITERKRAEAENQKLNAELEQRVLQRTAQLTAVNHELEAFSHSVSHDLRAPLRHILGYSELLKASAHSVLDEQGRHFLHTISESVTRMGALIDDLLSFSRMGRAEMRRRTVELQQLVTAVIADLQMETQGRKIIWKVAALPAVQGDHSMLRQVFANLIGNALKYTRTRPQAVIEIGSTDGDAEQTTFFIRDNGVGFNMEYADKLFGVFQRLHLAEEFEGTGIGLANVRRVIQRHGGNTWAQGTVDGGATFFFSLPKAQDK